jgi:hypothetical protein
MRAHIKLFLKESILAQTRGEKIGVVIGEPLWWR